MSYKIVIAGQSRSFPDTHPFLDGAAAEGDGIVYLGEGAGDAFAGKPANSSASFVAIELGTECLGVYTGENAGKEGSNVVGFARFRLGDAPPSNLIELVRQPGTSSSAI